MSDTIRAHLLLSNWSKWLVDNFSDRNVNLRFHQMLWILIPHGLVPLALDRISRLSQILSTIVIKWSLAELFVNFSKPSEICRIGIFFFLGSRSDLLKLLNPKPI